MRFGLPISTAKRYINDLVEWLIPFLEWVYTERGTGRLGFTHGACKELRAVFETIQARYGTRNGRPQSITGAIQDSCQKSGSVASTGEPEPYDDQPMAYEEAESVDDSVRENLNENHEDEF